MPVTLAMSSTETPSMVSSLGTPPQGSIVGIRKGVYSP